jgi:beta-phosphoglucomutase
MNKGVIFDLDGVLVDTRDCHRQSWKDLCQANAGWKYDDTFFLETFGCQNFEIIPQWAGQPMTPEQCVPHSASKEKRYRELMGSGLELLEGVENLLKALKDQGFGLAIGTSTPKDNLDFMLKHTPAGNYFDAYIAAEDVTNSKPAPDTFLAAAQKLDLKPHQCVVIEDAAVGIQAAKAGKMPVIAVTNTRERKYLNQADRIVDSLAELAPQDFEALLELTFNAKSP